jgi:predicted membrane protein DUF2127
VPAARAQLSSPSESPTRRWGILALTIFFICGALMSGLTAFLLAFPGTILDAVWKANPQARQNLHTMGIAAIVMMIVVSAACATAAVGLWRRARWGYWRAIIILSANLVGDTLAAFFRHDWRTLVGLPVGGAMIAYLISRRQIFRLQA